jgi:O6-methylguanine-DNA--protein-cysteine methyltransferase
MSKELIDRLAKEHLKRGEVIADHEGYGAFTVTPNGEFVRYDDVAKMIEAYQAAAPIDNVAEALEKAAKLCDRYINHEASEGRDPTPILLIQEEIRALIPDTQAKKEGE